MTCAYPTCEYVADTHLLKFQCLQNRILCTAGNLYGCTSVHKLHMAFKVPHMYDCITKFCRTQAEVILNHVPVYQNVHGIGQGEARCGKYKRLKLGSSQTYNHSADLSIVPK
jgi:hypothetical protein